jgi:26S proteasome regulatory subunit T1
MRMYPELPIWRVEVMADDGSDIEVLKTYGAAPYATALKKLEKQINEKQASVNEKIGVKVLGSVDDYLGLL